MGQVEALQALLGGRGDAAPAIPALTPSLTEEDEPGSASVAEAASPKAASDVADMVLGIEYVDAIGARSVRRIRLRSVKPQDTGAWLVTAYCFERRAVRQFRYDRIVTVFDLDGVIHPRDTYFLSVLGIDVPESGRVAQLPGAKPTEPRRRPRESATVTRMKRSHGREMRLLAAMARVDDDFADEEVDAILAYLAAEATRDGLTMDADDRLNLARFVKRLRPSGDAIEDGIFAVSCLDEEDQVRFFAALEAVMAADGMIDPRERVLLDEARRGRQ